MLWLTATRQPAIAAEARQAPAVRMTRLGPKRQRIVKSICAPCSCCICLTHAMTYPSDNETVSSQVEDALSAIAVWREDTVAAGIVDAVVKGELPALFAPWVNARGFETKGSIGQGSTADVPWVG